jgi:hypothetical protein
LVNVGDRTEDFVPCQSAVAHQAIGEACGIQRLAVPIALRLKPSAIRAVLLAPMMSKPSRCANAQAGNNTDPYVLLADPGGMLTMSRRVSPRVTFSNGRSRRHVDHEPARLAACDLFQLLDQQPMMRGWCLPDR